MWNNFWNNFEIVSELRLDILSGIVSEIVSVIVHRNSFLSYYVNVSWNRSCSSFWNLHQIYWRGGNPEWACFSEYFPFVIGFLNFLNFYISFIFLDFWIFRCIQLWKRVYGGRLPLLPEIVVPTDLPTYLPKGILTYIPTHVPTYLSTYVPTYLTP